MGAFLSRYRTAVVAAVLVLFGILLSVLSFGNHLCFRTYGLDLGIYTKVAYDYSRLNVNDCSFFLWEPSNILADHFDLLLVLLSPLVRLFGASALLAVQILAVLFGALGMYRLAGRQSPFIVQLSSMLMPLVSFGVWHAVGFDYHSNVVGAMLLPWLLLFVRQRRLWPSVVVAVLIAVCKESSALWLLFVLAALAVGHWRERGTRRALLVGIVVTMVYLAVVTMLVMPSLGGSSRGFWRYEWMGASFAEVARWLVTHPFEAVRDLFVDFTKDADCGHLKTEFFVCFLLSGGICCLLKPSYLIMLIPPLALKMLSRDPTNFWGLTFHYNVELCMVACVAAAEVFGGQRSVEGGRSGFRIRRLTAGNWPLATVMLVLTVGTLLYSVDEPRSDIRRAHVNLMDRQHYRMDEFDASAARRMIRQIPPDASVCATTMFTPHLATRDSVYIFPLGLAHNAEYYLLRRSCWSYYDGDEELVASMIGDTTAYRVLDTDGHLYLLQRR